MSDAVLDNLMINQAKKKQRLAALAYEAYCEHTGWKSAVTGAPLPAFADCPETVQAAWMRAACVLVANYSLLDVTALDDLAHNINGRAEISATLRLRQNRDRQCVIADHHEFAKNAYITAAQMAIDLANALAG